MKDDFHPNKEEVNMKHFLAQVPKQQKWIALQIVFQPINILNSINYRKASQVQFNCNPLKVTKVTYEWRSAGGWIPP